MLALLVAAWWLWPRPPSAPAIGAIATGRAAEAPTPPAPPPSPSALRVTRFEIPVFPKLDRDHFDPKRAGLLGQSAFAAREDDDVTVRAELSEPAYSFLVAYRPDGTVELCDPEDENTPPPRKLGPSYPPPGKRDERYRLSEGAGLYAFALIVSREPLPSYREWKRRVGSGPWAARLPSEPGTVWRDDGQGLQVLLADNGAVTRGKGAKARDWAVRPPSWRAGCADCRASTSSPSKPSRSSRLAGVDAGGCPDRDDLATRLLGEVDSMMRSIMSATRLVPRAGLRIGVGLAISISIPARPTTGQPSKPAESRLQAPGLQKLSVVNARRAEELDKAIASALKGDRWDEAIAGAEGLLALRRGARGRRTSRRSTRTGNSRPCAR